MPPAESPRYPSPSIPTPSNAPNAPDMNPQALPTLAEEDAPPETRDLFEDLRKVLKVPVVPLAWRHLATLPGVLPWCWESLRPIYLSGAIDRAASRLMAAAPLPGLPRLSPAVLTAVGVPEGDLPTLALTLETFNRSNPMNLVALSVLLNGASARGTAPGTVKDAAWLGGSAHAEGKPGAPAIPRGIPLMLAQDAMPPEACALAWELTHMGGPGAPEALPSVWRILAHWPGYLALAVALLAPLEVNGWLPGARENLQERLGDVVRDLIADNPIPPPPLTKAEAAALENALRRLTGSVITRIIPKLAVLRHTLPQHLGN